MILDIVRSFFKKLIVSNTKIHTPMKRESNIELLRIVAMLLLMGVHANYVALGAPDASDIIENPTNAFFRILTENICIVGVNVFVMISGWFGIRYKAKGLCNLLFQCLFFSIAVYIIYFITGRVEFNRMNIMSSFLLYKNAYWFVWAYLILYVIAPMLNTFIEYSDQKTFKRALIMFWTVEMTVCLFTFCGFFKSGYNPLHFIGLYLLARYFNLYIKNYDKWKCLATYALCVICNTLMCFLPAMLSGKENNTLSSISFAYTGPFNIIGALALLLFFTKLEIKSKLINWISISCLTVYIIHSHECIYLQYRAAALYIYNNYSGVIFFAVMIAFILSVFIACILVDKIRIYLFNYLWNRYERIKQQ